MLTRLLLDPNPSEGGGNPAPAPAPAADPSEGFKAALAKHNNDANALAREAWQASERLRAERDDLKAKLPGKGSVVLSGDDATAWGELSKLGKAGEIRARLEEGTAAAKEVATFRREKLIGQAAATVGYDPDVLMDRAGDLEIEIKDGTRGGKPAKIAEVVVRSVDDKGAEVVTRTAIDKYAEKEWAKYLPSLKAASTQQARATGPGTGRPNAANPPARREGAPTPPRLSF